MISSSTNGSLESFDPWVVPRFEDVESSRASMPLTTIYIVDPKIPSASPNTSQHLHPHMEGYHPTPSIWIVDSLSSHDSLDFDFPLEEAILDVMDYIDKSKEDEHHLESILPSLELMRVDMMGIDLRLEAFVGTPSETPSLDPFPPQLYF
jgi:hypothetical protein